MANEEFKVSNFATHTEELEFLSSQGFATNPLNSSVNSIKDAWAKSQEISVKRRQMPFQIDGLVIKLNDNNLVKKLGIVGKTPRGWCAIKFAAQEVTTKVVDIAWQVGRTGKITPVANLEPVELDGTTVKRATLHNAKEVVEKNILPKDVVVIRKAGDIIPEVLQILYHLREGFNPENQEEKQENSENQQEKIIPEFKLINSNLLPKTCPSCGQNLVASKTEVDLFCPNTNDCPAQIMLRLSYFTSRGLADISGLSDKLIEKFVTDFKVKDIPDLYDLPWDGIIQTDGFGEKLVQNLQKSIQKSKQIDDYIFLASLGIEGIGKEVAKLIIQSAKLSEKISEKNEIEIEIEKKQIQDFAKLENKTQVVEESLDNSLF